MTDCRSRRRPVGLIVLVAAVTLATACGSAPGPGPPAGTLPPNPPRPAACPPPPSADVTTRSGWLGWTATRPDDVAFVVDDGRGRVVSHGADRPMPLASAVKVVHLAAYGRAVADGRVRADEPVPVAEWERWYLPTDGGAHQAALARLRPGATVTVDQMVGAMIRESDNAAADWLRERLGDDALTRAAADGGWTPFDLPSELGAALALVLPEQAPPPEAPRSERAPVEVALARRYAADPSFREESGRRLAAATADPERWRAANGRWAPHTGVGTAAQLAGLYRALATGAYGAGAEVARRHLEWLGPRPTGTLGFKAGQFLGVTTLGASLRRADGTTGYGVVLGNHLPADGERVAVAQLALATSAMDDPRRVDALACVARGGSGR